MAGLDCILFDLDGLLVDSEPLQYRAYRRAFADYGIALELEDWIRWHSVEASTRRWIEREGIDIDVDELHTLPGRFVEEPVTEPLVAVEAYIGTDEFFLAYEGPDGLVYSGGNWSNRIDLNALRQGPDGDYAGPFILSLEYRF